MVHSLARQHSYIGNIMYQLRNIDIQNDRFRFRHNLRRFGMFAAFELSKHLQFSTVEAQTILGSSEVNIIQEEIVALGILRAGLPLQQGIMDCFEEAHGAFVSAYRREKPDGSFDISMDYITCPELENKILILADPMLATGRSVEAAMQMINEYGTPLEVHLISVIASDSGIEHLRRLFPQMHIWVGAIDMELTAKSYIVPGLGDAGDLAFGRKLQG